MGQMSSAELLNATGYCWWGSCRCAGPGEWPGGGQVTAKTLGRQLQGREQIIVNRFDRMAGGRRRHIDPGDDRSSAVRWASNSARVSPASSTLPIEVA